MWSNLLRATQPDGWEEEEDYSESEAPAQEDMIPPSARLAAGVNRLSGRLTQFLVDVTQREDDSQEEEEDGWAENDDELDQVLDEVDVMQQNEWDEQGIPDLHDEIPTMQIEPTAASAAEGWDNEEEAFDFSAPSGEDTEQLTEEEPWQEPSNMNEDWNQDEDALDISADRVVEEELENGHLSAKPTEEEPEQLSEVVPSQDPLDMNEGWNEDEDALDLSSPTDRSVKEKLESDRRTAGPNEEEPEQLSEVEPSQEPLDMNEGWNEDDDALELSGFSDRAMKEELDSEPLFSKPIAEELGKFSEVETSQEPMNMNEGWNEDEDALDLSGPTGHSVKEELDNEPLSAQPIGEETGQFSEVEPSQEPMNMNEGWNEDEDALDLSGPTDHAVKEELENDPLSAKPNEEEAEPFQQATRRMSMVDHVPLSEDGDHPVQASDLSLAVLAAADDRTRDTGPVGDEQEGLIEEEQDVYDDENELLFAPVVDNCPRSNAVPLIRGDSLAVQGNDGDGTLGETSGWADDEDDLSAVIDDSPELEGPTTFSSDLTVQSHLADHTPSEAKPRPTADASVDVLASEIDSIAAQDEFVDFDPQNDKHAFGPIVDLTPLASSPKETLLSSMDDLPPAPFTGSLAVNVEALEQDIREDEEMDDTLNGDSIGAGGNSSGWEEDDILPDDAEEFEEQSIPLEPKRPEKKTTTFSSQLTTQVYVVDHTPSELAMGEKATLLDPSINVLAAEEDLTRDTGTGDDEEVYDNENEMNYGLVVDHLPRTPNRSVAGSGDNSMDVNASALKRDFEEDEKMDDSYYGDSTVEERLASDVVSRDGWEDDNIILDGEDENCDKSSAALSEDDIEKRKMPHKKTTTFSSELTMQSHLVDHTPSEMKVENESEVDPSVAALAAGEGITRNTEISVEEEVYDEENEMNYGPVVDVLPKTPNRPVSDSVANSLAVHFKKDFEDDSCYDSTIGGTSGWDQEDRVLGDQGSDPDGEEPSSTIAVDDIVVVDHTPSELGPVSSLVRDPSADFTGSEGLTKEDGDVDSTGENVVYGPVVDRYPNVTPAPLNIRSDSILVQLGEEDEATLEGEDTIIEGSTVDDETTVDEEMPGPLRSEEDKLVDHCPPRSDSRFGDASTGVAADPSEILSEVDDITQEGAGNFGPVVDITPIQPLSGTPEHPSGAGSTIVFAPSMLADDLDDADDTEAEDDSWGQDHPEIITEAAPNPQSGNDEPIDQAGEEQLVDFIPAADSVVARTARDAASELTIGAQSQLQVDPTEEDFGLIVDATPTVLSPGMSIASIATQITASEWRAMDKEDASEALSETTPKAKIVVDQLPDQRDLLKIDSFATVARSQLSEDDEEDDSKYGPIVDNLPTPRVSSAPSRGGSTVDALATVSENESCDNGDGWEDEIDFDGSEGCMSDKAALVSNAFVRGALRSSSQSQASSVDQERMSVRFDDSVTNDAHSTPAVDEEPPNLSDPLQVPDAISDSFAEADTPPSTPYRRADHGVMLPQGPGPTFPSMSVRGEIDCAIPKMDEHKALHSNDPDLSLQTKDEIHRLQSRIAELEGACFNLTEHNHALSTAMEDRINRQGVAEVCHLKEQLKIKENECNALQDQLLALLEMQGREADVKAESDRSKLFLEAEAKSLREARDDLSRQLVDLQKQHEQELQRQYDILDQKNTELRSLESTKAATEKERLSLFEQIAGLKQFEEKSELLAKELLSVAEERDLLQESLTSSNVALRSLQDLVDENGADIKVAQSKTHEELESLKREVQCLNEAIVTKDKELLSLQHASLTVTSENAELKTRLFQLETENSTNQASIVLLQSSVADEKAKSTYLESQLESLNQEIKRVSDERDLIQKQKDTTTHHLAELGKTLKKMDHAKLEQQSYIKELQTQLDQNRSEMSAVSGQRDDLRAEHDELVKRFHEMDATLAEYKDKLTQALHERDALSEENEELLVQFALIKEQLDESEERCFALQTKLEEPIHNSQSGIHAKQYEDLADLQTELQAASLSFNELVQEKESLQFQLECVNKEKESLIERLAVMESNGGNDETFKLENIQLAARIEELEAQCERTEEARKYLEVETQLLHERLRNTVALDSNSGELDHRLVELEAIVKEKDRALASKNKELLAAKKKLDGLVESTTHKNVLNELSQKRQALNQATNRITEWEQKYKSLETELERVRSNLVAAQSVPDIRGQVESLQRSLHTASTRLAAKEAEVDRLTAEIAKLESVTKDKSIAQTLNDASESTSDDIKTLRHQIVSLAVALERSENKRAEAIDRLQSEREMNSESLRRLSESMKRFYSTVSVKDV